MYASSMKLAILFLLNLVLIYFSLSLQCVTFGSRKLCLHMIYRMREVCTFSLYVLLKWCMHHFCVNVSFMHVVPGVSLYQRVFLCGQFILEHFRLSLSRSALLCEQWADLTFISLRGTLLGAGVLPRSPHQKPDVSSI